MQLMLLDECIAFITLLCTRWSSPSKAKHEKQFITINPGGHVHRAEPFLMGSHSRTMLRFIQ